MSELAIKGGDPVRRAAFARFPEFDDEELSGLREVLESGVWGGYHPKVKEFEQAFAAFLGSKYGITAANGTVTLETALLAAGVGPGDEVIVPPISFVATATAVLRVGAVPVFVDVDPSTINIDPSKVAEVVNENTRAIIPVHFAGHPADMDAIMSIAERHDLKVIEDCAHAHGATWNDKPVGSFGTSGRSVSRLRRISPLARAASLPSTTMSSPSLHVQFATKADAQAVRGTNTSALGRTTE